jgi:pyruvyltransferase
MISFTRLRAEFLPSKQVDPMCKPPRAVGNVIREEMGLCKRSGTLPILLKQFLATPNAGDVASRPIVSYVASRPVEVIGEAASEASNLLAIGSILHWADCNSIIWGTGLIADHVVLNVKPRAVLAVRGHLTWERLQGQGIDSPQVFGDPGVFLPQLYPKQPVQCSLGIVPHYVDRYDPFVCRAAASGAEVIDVAAPLPQFAAALSSCERIVSSSLHGLIFAHAYGIPGAWLRLSDKVHGSGFKFFDYYSSIGIERDDVPVSTADQKLDAIVRRCHLPPSPVNQPALRATLVEGLRKWSERW